MSTVRFNRWLNSDGTNRQTVMQVVQSVKTDTYVGSGASNLWYDTGFEASITPKFTTSRIMLVFTGMLATGYWELQGKFQRSIGGGGFADIGTGDRGPQTNTNTRCGFTHNHYMNSYYSLWYPCNYTFVDSPNTTSSTTYRLFLNSYSSSALYINRTKDDYESSDYHGCPISTITLMEIAA